jgi:hypothetical protein
MRGMAALRPFLDLRGSILASTTWIQGVRFGPFLWLRFWRIEGPTPAPMLQFRGTGRPPIQDSPQ